MRRLRAASIGSISAWLPSRRSTLHHNGGAVITLSGQVRAPLSIGANGRYFLVGSCNMVGVPVLRQPRPGPGLQRSGESSGFLAPVPGERSVGLRLSDAGAGAYAAAHCLGGAARTVADSYAWAESSSRPATQGKKYRHMEQGIRRIAVATADQLLSGSRPGPSSARTSRSCGPRSGRSRPRARRRCRSSAASKVVRVDVEPAIVTSRRRQAGLPQHASGARLRS